jgi:hypothetical protein
VLINYVYPGSSAEAMGFRAGDELVGMDEKAVKDGADLGTRLRATSIGQAVRFRVRRSGDEMDLTGTMGGFESTRKGYLERMRRDFLGKPFAPLATIDWPDGIDGLRSLRGKVALVFCIDGCRTCLEGTYRSTVRRAEELRKLQQSWIGFAGITAADGKAASEAARKAAIERYPALFPIGVARYPGDRPPPDAPGRDPLIQQHGIVVLDPEGKVLYMELSPFEADPSGRELTRVLIEAAEKFGPRRGPAAARPPGPSGPSAEQGAGK